MTHPLKRWILSLGLAILLGGCTGETAESRVATDEPATPPVAANESAAIADVVEAACGQCQFDLPGAGCDLAVRIDGVAHFVEGTSIDEHGDAHAQDGFCNAIRSARVEGLVEGDVFVASSFELLSSDG